MNVAIEYTTHERATAMAKRLAVLGEAWRHHDEEPFIWHAELDDALTTALNAPPEFVLDLLVVAAHLTARVIEALDEN